MEPIAADEMVIEYVGQNIRQVGAAQGTAEGVAGHGAGPDLKPSLLPGDCRHEGETV